MTHLDDDVAAYVDGQLNAAAADAADRHLQGCERCRGAVLAQRQLKRRMSAGGALEPPAGLLEALGQVPHAPPPARPTWWRRAMRSPLWGATGVVVGASLVVAMAAYLAGHPIDGGDDIVVPPVDVYAAEFIEDSAAPEPSSATAVNTGGAVAASAMSARVMRDLTAHGWPCHGVLGKRLERVRGQLHDAGRVRLVYSDGSQRLELHEQDGVLDTERLDGFEPTQLGSTEVWVRQASGPRVVVWDSDSIVYTVVTDADDTALEEALADLPSPEARPDMTSRVGRGVARLADWMA